MRLKIGRTPKSLTLEIHHGGWFTPTPSRSYIGGHVSSVNVVDIDEFCLHDLKYIVVKLGYGVEDLMYYHFLIPSLGLDYGLHSLNVDADVLEMSKYVKDYKIIVVYVEHGSSNVDTSMFDCSPDVNRNVKKEWEKPTSSVARPIVVESVVDPFDGFDEILGTSSTADDFSFEKFKEVEVEADTELKEEESDTEGNDTSGSDSEDLDHNPNHDDVFDDDERIVEEVHVNMNNFSFTADPKHDTSIGDVVVQEDDLDVIDYVSFGSDLDNGIDSERRIQLRELRRLGKKKQGVRVRCEGTISALVPYVAIDTNMDKNVFSQTKCGLVIRENSNSGKHNILGKDKTVKGKGKKVITPKKIEKYPCPWTMLVTYTKECIWEVRTLIKDHTCIQSRVIKACTSRFLAYHVIKSFATNPDIPMRAVQDQMQKQFEVGVSKMKAFRAKRIASDIMTGSQILTAVGVDANNGIYSIYVIVEAESKASWYWFLNLLGEDLGIEANFNYTFISDRYCVRHIHENIKSQFKGVGVGIPEQWVHAAYRLETWAHVYSFKVSPCNERDMWPVVESKTVIIPPLYKPLVGSPPKKRKKSNDEIASHSASSGKLSRKGKLVSCGKCGNVGHNRKGCRGQGGGSSQAGARKVSGQAVGSRKVSGQAAGARKASSQPSATQSTTNQGPRQGFQGPIAGPASGSQRKTKKLVDL
ncbi:hypothetical protein Tco_1409488 [Tanacetum coccineum]